VSGIILTEETPDSGSDGDYLTVTVEWQQDGGKTTGNSVWTDTTKQVLFLALTAASMSSSILALYLAVESGVGMSFGQAEWGLFAGTGATIAVTNGALLQAAAAEAAMDPPRWDTWSSSREVSPYRPRPRAPAGWNEKIELHLYDELLKLSAQWLAAEERRQAADLAGSVIVSELHKAHRDHAFRRIGAAVKQIEMCQRGRPSITKEQARAGADKIVAYSPHLRPVVDDMLRRLAV